jgi:hypothetical protein
MKDGSISFTKARPALPEVDVLLDHRGAQL